MNELKIATFVAWISIAWHETKQFQTRIYLRANHILGHSFMAGDKMLKYMYFFSTRLEDGKVLAKLKLHFDIFSIKRKYTSNKFYRQNLSISDHETKSMRTKFWVDQAK